MIVVGLFGGDITLSLPLVPMRAMTIQGSYTGSLQELNELIELVRAPAVAAGADQNHPLDAAQGVIADLKAGKVIGRVVLTPN